MKCERESPLRSCNVCVCVCVCDGVSQASTAGGFCSGPASRAPSVHGAVLPPLQLLQIPGAEDRHAEGPDERGLLGAGAHHSGVQEPGQDAPASEETQSGFSPVYLREDRSECNDVMRKVRVKYVTSDINYDLILHQISMYKRYKRHFIYSVK